MSPSTLTDSDFSSFMAKQESCISSLKSWNVSARSLFKNKIVALNKSIADLQNNLPLEESNVAEIKALQSQSNPFLYKEEVYWRQHARVSWRNAGDKNTKFFHRFASKRKKANTIHFLNTEDGEIVNSLEGISNIVSSYFANLFHSQGCDSASVEQILSALDPPLNNFEIDYLGEPFRAEEVKKVVFHLSGDKAHGLDGLNALFYQKNWSTIG
uniref:Uncharacterized protein n=1 Tax=Cannabis sativa TaxID=3483 RepID=A0A803PA22_CANSA